MLVNTNIIWVYFEQSSANGHLALKVLIYWNPYITVIAMEDGPMYCVKYDPSFTLYIV